MDNWMSEYLTEKVRDEIPIIYLAIPGSHDSMSYGIKKNAKVAPDAEAIVDRIYKYIPCVVRRWAKTQRYTVSEQLENGIRYFDLRISTKPKCTNLYFVHGLFCEEIIEPLKELSTFLESHPKELVILDFQHFYNFTTNHHIKLIEIINSIFGLKIFDKNSRALNELTLNLAHDMGKQLIIIYRDVKHSPDTYMTSSDYPTPWPNMTNVDGLKKYLDKRLTYRSNETGYVSQCVLTPDVKFIIPRFYSTLRQKCAKRVDKKLTNWIQNQRPGIFEKGESPTCNVFLADFIDIRESNFSKIVVELNNKIEFEKST